MKIGRQTKLSWLAIVALIFINGLVAYYDMNLTVEFSPNAVYRWVPSIVFGAVSFLVVMFLSQSQFESRGSMIAATFTVVVTCLYPLLVLSAEGAARGRELGLEVGQGTLHLNTLYIAVPFMIATALPLLIVIVVSQGKPEWRDIEQLESDVIEAEATALVNPMTAVARGYISNKVRTHIIRRDNRTCLYCGRQGTEALDPLGQTWHIDHVIPVRRGGLTHADNLALACSRCNLRKGAMPAYQFIQTILQESRN